KVIGAKGVDGDEDHRGVGIGGRGAAGCGVLAARAACDEEQEKKRDDLAHQKQAPSSEDRAPHRLQQEMRTRLLTYRVALPRPRDKARLPLSRASLARISHQIG